VYLIVKGGGKEGKISLLFGRDVSGSSLSVDKEGWRVRGARQRV
jgi:hypothetical protein